MKIHDLKIKYSYWLLVYKGIKTFELRKNDRNFEIGDHIHFEVVDDESLQPIIFKNPLYGFMKDCRFHYEITYILDNVPEYGLNNGYCILGIKTLGSMHYGHLDRIEVLHGNIIKSL